MERGNPRGVTGSPRAGKIRLNAITVENRVTSKKTIGHVRAREEEKIGG